MVVIRPTGPEYPIYELSISADYSESSRKKKHFEFSKCGTQSSFLPFHGNNKSRKVIVISSAPAVMSSRHISRPHSHHGHHHSSQSSTTRDQAATVAIKPNKYYWERVPNMKRKGAETLQIAGSSLPDCSHACGSCSPCRLVMVDEDEIYWRQKKSDEEVEWSHNSTHVIQQLAQCFTSAMVGSRSWIGGLFNRSSNKRNEKFIDYPLTPVQEGRLQRLQERLQTPFDESLPDHQEALRVLWHAAFPDVALNGLISEQWKEMGWQGPNPSTDFRLLFKQDGDRAMWEYPFAVAGINVSFMLIQMLDLYSAKPRCLPGINFVRLLGEDEEAFDVLYCIAFEMMDAQWLAMHASYMEFNVLSLSRSLLI
ncbi:hypothetical protein JRO89_XS01G0172200 [Xanthoceras sorbifolium]|uniref:ELMO domain-containing protein n=1 Tax=Xanthoceras sorbifolium TaxID=99658 RepID=A0ABQ8IJY9_9ROSI|nr:hypothetical protein JRO89_XS01G0172200 [Xanthoceras sorbifolium]